MTFIKTINLKAYAAFIIINFTAAFILVTCFSPYGADMGSLTISIGDSSRAIWQGNEYLDFEHEVIIIGPGGTRRQTFTGTGTARFSNLASGLYSINVRAVGDRPAAYNQFPSRMLRAYGIDTVEIRSGQTNNAHISMLPATEVINESQFRAALNNAGNAEEYILIKNDMEFPNDINLHNNIILIAEDTVTISRTTGSGSFFRLSNVHLKLGAMGMRGQLVLDGRGNLIITDVPSSTNIITMYDGITLRNSISSTGAVDTTGIFNMKGGIITENNGNGVSIHTGGIFNMEGGIISNNKRSGVNVGGQAGGGTTFNMYGGIISNNTEAGGGGGVNVTGGHFNMEGGIISGNTSYFESYAWGNFINGGGVHVRGGTDVTFKKTGGTIYGNNAGDNSNRVIGASRGHAVYIVQFGARPEKWLNTTVGPGVNLNSETDANWQF